MVWREQVVCSETHIVMRSAACYWSVMKLFVREVVRSCLMRRFSLFSLVMLYLLAPASYASNYVVPLYNVPTPGNATNVLQVCSAYEDSAIRNDGTTVPYLAGSSEVWRTNLLYVSVQETGNFEILPNHTMIKGPPGVSNIVGFIATEPEMILKADGTILLWSSYTATSNTVPGLTNAVAFEYNQNGGPLVLKSDGTVVAVGSGSFANGTNPPPSWTNVVSIIGGPNGSPSFDLALRRDGTVVNWGTNFYMRGIPPGLSNVVAIGCDGNSACVALLANGTVTNWGSTNFVKIPPGLTNVTQISADGRFAIVDTNFPGGVPVTGTMISNNTFAVKVPSLCSKVYSLEYTTSLANPNWVPLPLVAGNGVMLTLTDNNPMDQQRFYRVRRW